MRRLLTLVSLPVALLYATTARCEGDVFTRYRIPDHRWSSWTANFGGTGSHDHRDVVGSGSNWNGGVSGTLSLAGVLGRDADAGSYSFQLLQGVGGSRSGSRTEADTRSQRSQQRAVQQRTALALDWARYPFARPFGFALGAATTLEYQQGWSSNAARVVFGPDVNRNASNFETHQHQYFSTLRAGLTYGRLRDVTPVQSMLILEQRLLKTGALTRPLSDAGRERVAAFLATTGEVSFAHERSARWIWAELERLLREDGALAGEHLDAFSTLRAAEGVAVGAPLRSAGASVTLSTVLLASRDFRENWSVVSSALEQSGVLVASNESKRHEFDHRRFDFAAVSLALAAERPLGMRWQLGARSALLWIDQRAQLASQTSAQVGWLVADRWYASGLLFHALGAAGRGGSRRVQSWDAGLIAGLDYFVEDRWSVGASWQHQQTHDDHSFHDQDQFQVGIRRRLSGHFAAPGLVEPMRLSPVFD